MAYGWEVRRPTGKIVADSNSPNLMAVAKGTLSLDLQMGGRTTTQACDWDATNRQNINLNIYRANLPAPGVGEMHFFEVPNGHRVHTLKRAGPLEVWSTTNSLRWVRARFMRWVAKPADTYGIEVRDSAARLPYHSGANLLTMLGTVQSAPSGVWVSPETSFVFVTDVG